MSVSSTVFARLDWVGTMETPVGGVPGMANSLPNPPGAGSGAGAAAAQSPAAPGLAHAARLALLGLAHAGGVGLYGRAARSLGRG